MIVGGGLAVMGRASARLFAKEGATMFIAGRNEERGEVLAAEINKDGGKERREPSAVGTTPSLVSESEQAHCTFL